MLSCVIVCISSMNKPDASLHKPHTRWDKRNALVGLVVLVVFLGAGLMWYMATHKRATPQSKVPQYSGQQLVDEVNLRYGRHDYVGAIELIKGQQTINSTETQLLLAGAYANSGDNTRALEIYDRLDSENKLQESETAVAGEVAERTHDYQKAIAYYKKAKQRADPNFTDQLAVYDYKVTELEKKR